jgi:hypothetical protein
MPDMRQLYMGVAADCEYTAQYGYPPNATTQILNAFNSASSLYKVPTFSEPNLCSINAYTSHQSTFNVSLGIIELQIQNGT